MVLLLLIALASCARAAYSDFRIGRGIFDVTGETTEVGFMGMGE